MRYLRILMFAALLLTPVYGQVASTASPSPTSQANADPVAADPGPIPTVGEARDEAMQFPMVRTIGGMGIVVCLMIAAFFCAKKFAPRYFNKPTGQRNMKVVETLSMGDRRSISVIEVANNRFLVGNTPHQINLLAALPDPVSLVSEPDTISANPRAAEKKAAGNQFRNLFEVEKNRALQYSASPLPEDLRTKMRQLRDSLERS